MASADIKASAMDFLRLAAFGKTDEAYEKYVDPRFIHHNPYFASDRESLKAAMAEAHKNAPNEIFEIRHALREGDLVAVHSRVRKLGQTVDIAVVHLFRFENGKAVELWDVGMVVPADSPNAIGMF